MNAITLFKKIIFCLLITPFLVSCDYLNVSDELASELNLEEVFTNTSYTRRFHRGIYTRIPDVSWMVLNSGYADVSGLGNPWPACSDELKAAYKNVKDIPVTGYHAGSATLTRWQMYHAIRQANIFLARVQPILTDKDPLDETEVDQMKAEARFLKAYYHFLLFELYGAIPIQDEVIEPGDSELDFSRASIDETLAYLDKEFSEVAENLNDVEPEERLGVPTKGVALAIRAKMWVYAASPLLNGGYEEAVALRDNDGKQLYPEYDASKWQKAVDALEQFMSYAEGRYSLYKVYKKGELDVDASLYGLFQNYNDEIIWASTQDSWGGTEAEGFQKRCTPRGVQGTVGVPSLGVTQELVDAFFMKDGLSIKESDLYTETGFTDITHDIQKFKDTVTVTDEIYNMYLNREPRFYQAVTYAGKRWQIGGDQIFFHRGAPDDMSSPNNSFTGYMLFKRVNRTLYGMGAWPRSYFRPGILFRLAEFYLLYAEALNEVNPLDTRIIEYVDKIRERAGIPLLKDIKPEIIGNQDLQRKAIRQERRVELCTEGQRYFDVRRWMVAENDSPEEGGQGGEFHGMNMNADYSGFFQRATFETRLFDRRMYLYPLPLSQVQQSKRLVQNPGW